MENKENTANTKNFLDFQEGDAVYDLMFGNGYVFWVNYSHRIFVAFTEDKEEAMVHKEAEQDEYSTNVGEYTYTGQILEYITTEEDSILLPEHVHRTLFHGHDLKVHVSEKEPVRYKWVNVYLDGCGSPYFGIVDDKHKIPQEAKEVPNYITTIELKPKN